MSQEQRKMPVAATGEQSGAVLIPAVAVSHSENAQESRHPGETENSARTLLEGVSGQTGIVRLTPEDYTFVWPEDAPGEAVDAAVMDRFKCFCSQSGLSTEQAQKAVDFYLAEQGHALTGMREQCEMHLRSRWNHRYDECLAMARNACVTLDRRMDGRLMPLVQAGLGSHPVFGELMALVGESLSEDSFRHAGASSAPDVPMSGEEFLRTVVFKGR